ncbi:MAG: spore coat protein [Bacillota bacterium]
MPFGGMSDRDMVGDLLATVKSMSSTYHQAILESANNNVRQTMETLHDDQVNQAKVLFDAMQARGWYKVEPARPTPPG